MFLLGFGVRGLAATGIAAAVTIGGIVGFPAIALASPGAPTVAAAAKPGAPGKPTASALDRGALLSWTAPKSTGGSAITGYVVTARPGGATVRTSAVTRFQVGGLTNGRVYRFTVRAVSRAGTGPASAASASVTPAAPTTPKPPGNVHVTAGYEQLTVTWRQPASDGGDPLTGFELTTSPKTTTVTTAPAATSATLTGLTDGTRYKVTVVAASAAGKSTAATAAAARPAVVTPSAPARVTATPYGSVGVTVGWSAPVSDGGESVTGYVITGARVRLTAGASATSITVTKGLTAGKSYTFTVAARNGKGAGPAATAPAATAGATAAAHTVVLSAASLRTLSSVASNGTLTFTSPSAQVTDLAGGDIVVAGVSAQTPAGLLAKVTSVAVSGLTATVATTPASLDDALKAGGFGGTAALTQEQVASFTPARAGVRLAPETATRPAATIGSITLSLDTDLYKSSNGREVAVDGSISLTPSVSFSASISCCVHTASSFTGTVTAAANLSLDAQDSVSISGSYTLGTIKFTPIVFDVAGVPVVIIPTLTVKLIAQGSVTAGLTTGAGASITVGAQVTTKDASVSAKPVYSRSTSFTAPVLYGSLSAAAGAEADLGVTVDGIDGPDLTDDVWLAKLSASTSANPWWTLSAENELDLDYQLKLLDHVFASYHATLSDESVTLARASGPYQAVVITPDPANVVPGGTLQLHAHVTGLAAQSVTWSAPNGNGTITSGGLYTAPKTPGTYEVTAAQRAAGLSTGATGLISIQVGYAPPGPPTAVKATAGGSGKATVTWTAPAASSTSPVTGYEVTSEPGWTSYPAAGSTRSLTVSGLASGSYTFTVTATGPGGTSVPSAASAPVKVSGASGAGSSTWTAPVEHDAVVSTESLSEMYPSLSCVAPDWCMVADSFGIWIYPDGLGNDYSPYQVDRPMQVNSEYDLVSCATMTFCMLATEGSTAIWNGGQLIQSTVIPSPVNDAFTAISCPTAGFCVAGTQAGQAYVWRSGTWSGPVTLFADSDGLNAVVAISCATTAYCVAVSQESAAVWDGGTWGPPVALGITEASSVSCPAVAWCRIAGRDSTDTYPVVLSFVSGTPGAPEKMADSGVFTISCASTSDCEAAQFEGTGGADTASFYNWDGASWGSALTYGTFFGYELALSCPTTTYCAAIDQYGLGMDSSAPAQDWGDWNFDLNEGDITSLSCISASWCLGSDFPGNQLAWDGSGWDGPSYVDDTVLGPVTCVSSSFCATIDAPGEFATWTPGAGWTAGAAPPSGWGVVTCATSTFCATYGDGDVYFWKGSTWTPAYSVDPAKNLVALDCPAASFCMAVSSTGKAYRWNGTAWAAVGSVAESTDSDVVLSCPTASFCMAGTGAGATATWNGSTWHAAPAFAGAWITQMSCVSSSYCVAALAASSLASYAAIEGSVSTWNGSGWTAPLLVDPDNEITALSCPTTTFCAAGDFTGQLLEFTNSSSDAVRSAPPVWRPVGSAHPPRLVREENLPRSPGFRR